MRPQAPIRVAAAAGEDRLSDRTEIVDRTAARGDADGHAKAGVDP